MTLLHANQIKPIETFTALQVLESVGYDPNTPKVKRAAEYLEMWISESMKAAKLDEAAEIHQEAWKIISVRPASAIVAGGTEVDKLMNIIERRHGKDMVLHVGGKHNRTGVQ